MSPQEQLSYISNQVKIVQDPAILFVLNKRANELQDEINRINQIHVVL